MFSNGLPSCAIPGFFIVPDPGRKQWGSGTPRDASSKPALAARGALCGARSPLGVPPRLLPEGQLVPKALHQAMLRGTVRSARSYTAAPTGGRRPCASPRALPAPEKRNDCPRTASTSRAGHSAGRMMPDAARERVTNPPAGTALAPFQGVSSRRTSLRWASGGASTRRAGRIQEIPAADAIPLI